MAKIKGRSALRISILVFTGGLLLQTLLVLLSEVSGFDIGPMYYTLNGSPAVSYPPQLVMIVILMAISVAAFLCLLINLYGLIQGGGRRFLLIAAGCFGFVSIVVPLRHFPFVWGSSLEFVLLILSLCAVLLFRILFAVALPQAVSWIKRLLIGASTIIFAAPVLLIIHYERIVISPDDMTLYERVFSALSLPLDFILASVFDLRWLTEIQLFWSWPSWTNVFLLADMLLFCTVLLPALWNLSKCLVVRVQARHQSADKEDTDGIALPECANRYQNEIDSRKMFKQALNFNLKKLSYRQQSYKGKFVTNVLRSLVLCGAALLSWPILVLLPPLSLVVLGAYVYLSYKYMIVLPKRNLLSVSVPAISLMIIALILTVIATFTFVSDLAMPLLYSVLNYSSYWIVQLISLLVVILLFGDSDFIFYWFYWAMFISAIVPTLLMYLGLRLKIWQRGKISKPHVLSEVPVHEGDGVVKDVPQSEKKKVPAWAVILIVMGALALLGASCAIGSTLMTGLSAGDIDQPGAVFSGAKAQQKPYLEEAREGLLAEFDIDIDPEVLVVISGRYVIVASYIRTQEGDIIYSDDSSSDGHYSYYDFRSDKTFVEGFHFNNDRLDFDLEDELLMSGVYSAEKITASDIASIIGTPEKQSFLLLDDRISADWYHITLFEKEMFHDGDYNDDFKIVEHSIFISRMGDDDVVIHRPFSGSGLAHIVEQGRQ